MNGFVFVYMHGMLVMLNAALNIPILFPLVACISTLHLWHKLYACTLHCSTLCGLDLCFPKNWSTKGYWIIAPVGRNTNF
jgi:hypothetical protein